MQVGYWKYKIMNFLVSKIKEPLEQYTYSSITIC
jgi:hypothetical protein